MRVYLVSIKITLIGTKYFEIISWFCFGAYIALHQDFSVFKAVIFLIQGDQFA
jgi:hypothetical protein